MSGVPPRLSLVTLGVADVARSTAFYERLGWVRAAASQEAITFFVLQGSALALFARDALADDAGIAPGEPGFRGVTLALNCDSRDEVDAVYAIWVEAGASPIKPPVEVFWGGYSSYVGDPDGHLWEIACNPFAPNDGDGRIQLDR